MNFKFQESSVYSSLGHNTVNPLYAFREGGTWVAEIFHNNLTAAIEELFLCKSFKDPYFIF